MKLADQANEIRTEHKKFMMARFETARAGIEERMSKAILDQAKKSDSVYINFKQFFPYGWGHREIEDWMIEELIAYLREEGCAVREHVFPSNHTHVVSW